MSSVENIRSLLRHMNWADTEVWKKILSFSSAANDERLKKLLYHLHQVQYAFLALWNNTSIKPPKSETFPDPGSIAKWGFDYQKNLDDFLLLPQSNEIENIVQIPWSVFMERRIGKKVVPATLEETMLQVASHSTYHRAQINSRLRELGGEPPMTDFIAWIWLGIPKVEWDKLF